MDPTIAPVISAVAAVFSAVTAGVSVWTAWRVAKMQRSLNQRQLLLPLWEYMSSLDEIDPRKPATPAVLKVVNTLELVALCCEGGMVNKGIIKRTFRAGFMKHYDAINACVDLPGLTKTGADLLRENPAAMAFRQELLQEHLEQDKPKKLGKGD